MIHTPKNKPDTLIILASITASSMLCRSSWMLCCVCELLLRLPQCLKSHWTVFDCHFNIIKYLKAIIVSIDHWHTRATHQFVLIILTTDFVCNGTDYQCLKLLSNFRVSLKIVLRRAINFVVTKSNTNYSAKILADMSQPLSHRFIETKYAIGMDFDQS